MNRGLLAAWPALLALLAMTPPWAVSEAREPTEFEQYLLELINRARMSPGQEVARYQGEKWGDDPGGAYPKPQIPSLMEGGAYPAITDAAKPPLAFQVQLMDSATTNADLLLAAEAIHHNVNGTTPTSRAQAAGYTGVGIGENIMLSTSSGANPISRALVEAHHRGLFVDNNVIERKHRVIMLLDRFNEVGVAIRPDSDKQSALGPAYISDVLTCQVFGTATGKTYITGVAYQDKDKNSFYTPNAGEALAAVTIEAWIGGAKHASATAFASGGYSLAVAKGDYQVRARKGDLVADAGLVSVGATSVKLDFKDPLFQPETGLVVGGPVSGGLPFPPPTVTSFQGSIILSWKGAPGVSGYHVEASEDLKSWTALAKVSNGETVFRDNSPIPRRRFYRLFAMR